MEELLKYLGAIDPNLLYTALIGGLWIGVTAAYIPGTLVKEVAAGILLTASFLILTMMPTNWIALLVLIVGVSACLMLPFMGKRYGQFAEVGLVFQALGSYFLLPNGAISPILIGVLVVLGVIYNRLVLVPTMNTRRAGSALAASEVVIGQRGRVVKPLDPVGTVYVNKELWRARSADSLPADTAVIVSGQEGLELYVEKAKTEDAPAYEQKSRGASS